VLCHAWEFLAGAFAYKLKKPVRFDFFDFSTVAARERISRRIAQGRDASDVHPEIHDLEVLRREAWPPGVPQVHVDTEQHLPLQTECVFAALRLRFG
jgi:hypothetical protein